MTVSFAIFKWLFFDSDSDADSDLLRLALLLFLLSPVHQIKLKTL